MEVKELKINNIVSIVGQPSGERFNYSIPSGQSIDMIFVERNNHYPKPIPLTEEWLVKFEEVEKIIFDSEETGYGIEYHVKINEDLMINIQEDMSFCLESIKNKDLSLSLNNDYMDTVHFFQNIYNVLTKGKELTLNNNN